MMVGGFATEMEALNALSGSGPLAEVRPGFGVFAVLAFGPVGGVPVVAGPPLGLQLLKRETTAIKTAPIESLILILMISFG
jgi:hypothetical protein